MEIMDEFVGRVVRIDADEKLQRTQDEYTAAVHAYYAAEAKLNACQNLREAEGLAILHNRASITAWACEHRLGVAKSNALAATLDAPLTREELAEELRRAVRSRAEIATDGRTYQESILLQLEDAQRWVDGGMNRAMMDECKACKAFWPWGDMLRMTAKQQERAWAVIQTHCVVRPHTPIERSEHGIELLDGTNPTPRFTSIVYAPPYPLRAERLQRDIYRIVAADA